MRTLFLMILFSSLFSTAEAKLRPVFEANVVGAVGLLPDYPASDEQHVKTIVLPFVTYRGENVKSSLDGVRAGVVRSAVFGVDASLSGSLPTNSDKSTARMGMPNLDTMFELGPSIFLLLPAGQASEFRIQLPIRAVFSTDFSTWVDRGFIFAPGFKFRYALNDDASQNLTAYLSVNYMTDRFNGYIYDVDTPYVTADRPYYRAKSGYTYSHLSLGYDIEFSRFKFLVIGAVESYEGSANKESPLYKTDFGTSILGALVFGFFHSSKLVSTM